MIEIVRLLARNPSLLGTGFDPMELCAARERLQNALHVLERTLQSMDQDSRESTSNGTFQQV
jgi:hypothetical protein